MSKFHRTAFASRRLSDFNYASGRAYFVTLCVQDRRPRFGAIQHGTMWPSAEGSIVAEEWARSALLRPGVQLDEFVVMPDHLHAIVLLPASANPDRPLHARTGLSRSPRSLSSLIAQFKATTTRRINLCRGISGRRLWQRNYHDRIIRNAAEMGRIRAYVVQNPVRWVAPADAARQGGLL